MDDTPSPNNAPAPRDLIADLIARILAAHWLRQRRDCLPVEDDPLPAANVTLPPRRSD